MQPQDEQDKPRQTGAVSNLVRASNGGEMDVRCFYVTSYGSAYNPSNSAQTPQERKLNTSFRWDQPTLHSTPNCTGYKKNLLPYFDYDKSIDEDHIFKIDNAFETTHTHDYLGKQPHVAMGNKSVVAHIPDGKLQKPVLSSHVVKLTANEADPPSTQKADYNDPAWFYQAKHAPVITGLGECESGWVRDRNHNIAGLSDRLPFPDRSTRVETPTPKNVSQIGGTGFNRPDARIPEHPVERMPGAISHSRTIHDAPRPRDSPQKRNTDHLKKEAAGAVKDWPKDAILTAVTDSRWDTSYTTRSGVAVNDSSNRSGYVMCNKFEFEPFDTAIEQVKHSGQLMDLLHKRKDRSLWQRVGQPGL
ncbi:hypothetical protein RI367_002140 [Sorochytrium milnesiophthora]